MAMLQGLLNLAFLPSPVCLPPLPVFCSLAPAQSGARKGIAVYLGKPIN